MTRLEDFTANLVKSGLVPPEVLARAQRELPPAAGGDAAVHLARRLIQDKRLTAFQAKKVLSGKTSGFFLGGYRLLKPLGEGGMGKVYLAENDRGRALAYFLAAVALSGQGRHVEAQQALVRCKRSLRLGAEAMEAAAQWEEQEDGAGDDA